MTDEGLLLIGHLRKQMAPTPTKKERESCDSPPPNGGGESRKKIKRQIKWNPNGHYKCIKDSERVMQNMDEINEITNPCEQDFCIYMNEHECASRDKDVPLYEAVYKCRDGTFVRVQINHLKAAYTAAGKKDVKKAWDINEQDGLPYWVDRYAYSKIK